MLGAATALSLELSIDLLRLEARHPHPGECKLPLGGHGNGWLLLLLLLAAEQLSAVVGPKRDALQHNRKGSRHERRGRAQGQRVWHPRQKREQLQSAHREHVGRLEGYEAAANGNQRQKVERLRIRVVAERKQRERCKALNRLAFFASAFSANLKQRIDARNRLGRDAAVSANQRKMDHVRQIVGKLSERQAQRRRQLRDD